MIPPEQYWKMKKEQQRKMQEKADQEYFDGVEKSLENLELYYSSKQKPTKEKIDQIQSKLSELGWWSYYQESIREEYNSKYIRFYLYWSAEKPYFLYKSLWKEPNDYIPSKKDKFGLFLGKFLIFVLFCLFFCFLYFCYHMQPIQ